MSVQHIVLFRFPEPFGEAEAKDVRERVALWPEAIGGFEKLRLGADLNHGERARGYQLLLHTQHADEAAMRRYQQHPVHLEFAKWVADSGCEVLAFDYEIDDATTVVSERA